MALAERESGQDLDAFFAAWLDGHERAADALTRAAVSRAARTRR